MSNITINDIEPDHFGSSVDCLSTTALNTCVGFVIFLNDYKHIFIEHRSDVYFPPTINSKNVRLCFNNVAQHLFDILPESVIEAVFILGGQDGSRFEQLQKEINEMLRFDVQVDNMNESFHYKQLLKNITCYDVCFNKKSEAPAITGECNIDVIAGRDLFEDNKETIVVIQNISNFSTPDIIIVGVLVIEVKSTKRWFMVDGSVIQNNQNKPKDELDYLTQVMNHFHSHAESLGAVTVDQDMEVRLLNNARRLLKMTATNMEHQIEFVDADKEIYQNSGSSNDKTRIDGDNDEDLFQ